jgi:Phage-related tail fibre protein
MAKFTNLTLTDKGLALQTKAQTGTQLKFTRVAIGDGTLDDGDDLTQLTGLKHERMAVAIANLSIDNGSAVIKANFSNKDLTEEFYLKELGVFANDSEEGEILYAVANAGNNGDYLPAFNGSEVIEQAFTLSLVVGNATNVTATFAESIYVLKAGDTMTGPLVLSGNPTANLHAVTKQYVDNSFWDYYGTADPATVSGIIVKPMFRWADATNKIIKIRDFLNTAWIAFMDMETGNVLTNAATAGNATNVITSINGKAITNILESDGLTAKKATTSANCSGNSATATNATNSTNATNAGNADTTDGKHANDTANNIPVYDSSKTISGGSSTAKNLIRIEVTDLNISKPGYYLSANITPTGEYYDLEYKGDENYGTLIAIRTSDLLQYQRKKVNGAWSSWIQITDANGHDTWLAGSGFNEILKETSISVEPGATQTINLVSRGGHYYMFNVESWSAAGSMTVVNGYHPSLTCAYIVAGSRFENTAAKLVIINRELTVVTFHYSVIQKEAE